VDTIDENGIVRLKNIDGSHTSLLDNGHCLWLYGQPLSKDSLFLISFHIQVLKSLGLNTTLLHYQLNDPKKRKINLTMKTLLEHN
jgi:hypothetical protein